MITVGQVAGILEKRHPGCEDLGFEVKGPSSVFRDNSYELL